LSCLLLKTRRVGDWILSAVLGGRNQMGYSELLCLRIRSHLKTKTESGHWNGVFSIKDRTTGKVENCNSRVVVEVLCYWPEGREFEI
jgi:hypothetical protein